MAKEFKEWEKRFCAAELREARRVWFTQYQEVLEERSPEYDNVVSKYWVHGYEVHTQEEVREAVYEAEGVVGWQKFRCALKGLSTQDKLRLLVTRWHTYVIKADLRCELRKFERIRIHNYLGALLRGGQLVHARNDTLEAVK